MKTRGVREAKQDLSGCLLEAQKEPIVILNHGRPVGLLLGIDGYDFDDVALMTNTEFWRMIEQRRRQLSTSHEDVGQALFGVASERKPTRRPRHGKR